MSERFTIMQINPTQCTIRDTLINCNVVFSEHRRRLKLVKDYMNELYGDYVHELEVTNSLRDVVEELENENNLLKEDVKKVLFALAFAHFDDVKLGKTEIEAIKRLQKCVDDELLNMTNLNARLRYEIKEDIIDD